MLRRDSKSPSHTFTTETRTSKRQDPEMFFGVQLACNTDEVVPAQCQNMTLIKVEVQPPCIRFVIFDKMHTQSTIPVLQVSAVGNARVCLCLKALNTPPPTCLACFSCPPIVVRSYNCRYRSTNMVMVQTCNRPGVSWYKWLSESIG